MEIEGNAGVSISEIARAPIDGWSGSETIYYLAKKLPQEEAAQKWMEYEIASSH